MHGLGLNFGQNRFAVPRHFVCFVGIGLIENPKAVRHCFEIVGMLARRQKDFLDAFFDQG